MTEIYQHIVARMADYMATEQYRRLLLHARRCSTSSTLRLVTVVAAVVVVLVYANHSLSVRVRVQLIGHL